MPMPLRPPPIDDAKVLARYPFLPQSTEHTRGLLDENGISMDDLLSAAWLPAVFLPSSHEDCSALSLSTILSAFDSSIKR